MRAHARVIRLLQRIEAGTFDDDDLLEAQMIAEERNWPFPIEDTDPLTPVAGYDKPKTMRRPDPAPELQTVADAPRPETARQPETSGREEASTEDRLAYLEKMVALLWKVVHQIEGKAPKDPEPR